MTRARVCWRSDHGVTHADNSTLHVALSLKAADALYERGHKHSAMSAWALPDTDDVRAIAKQAAQAAFRWAEAVKAVGADEEWAIYGDADRSLVYYAVREIEWARRAMTRLLLERNDIERIILSDPVYTDDPVADAAVIGIKAAAGGLPIEEASFAGQPRPNSAHWAPKTKRTAPKDKPVFFAATQGVRDLSERLRALVKKTASKGVNIIALIDPVDCGDVETLEQIACATPNLFLAPAYDVSTDAPARFNEAKKLLKAHLGADDCLTAIADRIVETWPRAKRIANIYEHLFAEYDGVGCMMSDHAAPETVLLKEYARASNIPISFIAHGVDPITPAMRINPAQGDTVETELRSAAAAYKTCASHEDPPEITVHPQSHLRPGGLRVMRSLLRICAGAMPLKLKSIGILITLGDRWAAPDKALRPAVNALENLIANAPHDVEIIVRLRWDEGGAHLFDRLRKVHAGDHQLKLKVERQTDRPLRLFLKDCSIVVEAGGPTSARLDAFAAGTPVLRMYSEENVATRFATLNLVTPKVDAVNPWPDIVTFLSDNTQRTKLALKQFAFMRADTRPLNNS